MANRTPPLPLPHIDFAIKNQRKKVTAKLEEPGTHLDDTNMSRGLVSLRQSKRACSTIPWLSEAFRSNLGCMPTHSISPVLSHGLKAGRSEMRAGAGAVLGFAANHLSENCTPTVKLHLDARVNSVLTASRSALLVASASFFASSSAWMLSRLLSTA